MKRNLTVFTAIAALAAPMIVPAAALAQDRPSRERSSGDSDDSGRDNARSERRSERSDSGDRGRDRAAPPSRPSTPAPSNPSPGRSDRSGNDRSGRDWNQGRGDDNRGGQNRGGENRGWNRGGDNNPGQDRSRPDTNDRGGRDWNRNERPNQDRDWNRGDRPGQDRDWNRGGDNRGGQDWNRGDRNPDRSRTGRERQRREWSQRFNSSSWQRDWNRRNSSNWWRNDRRFRGWTGVRIGFYFAPGYGYYSVPRSYYGQRWYPGQFLPTIFWRYRMDDWRTYGLGYPPPGTRWVYVDNAIYLIDEYDGYILDVVRDAWRW